MSQPISKWVLRKLSQS